MSSNFKGSKRLERLPSNWYALRNKVLKRDNYSCTFAVSSSLRCGLPANQVDHINRGDDHSLDNLQALCESHHRTKTAKEGVSARIQRHESLKAKYLRPKETRF